MLPLYITLTTMAAMAYGCSPPEGGYVPPTPAQNVAFAKHVVVGEVKSRLQEDPLYTYDTAYAVSVYVQCTYKGSPLGGYITIVGAGFIPGMCTSKDLEVGKKYLIFLHSPTITENGTFYEQSEMPEPSRNVTNYLNVCGLKMTYPEENGMMLKRKVCDQEKQAGPCMEYDIKSDQTLEKSRPVAAVKSGTATDMQSKEIVSVKMEEQQNTTPQGGNTGNGLHASFGVFLLSLLSIAAL